VVESVRPLILDNIVAAAAQSAAGCVWACTSDTANARVLARAEVTERVSIF
jgi:hypothetical protein